MSEIIVRTYRKKEVFERERVVNYMGHPLNQLQAKSFQWHARRLNTIVRKWQHTSNEFVVSYLNGKKETAIVYKDKTFPSLISRGHGSLDLYEVYNILPIIGKHAIMSEVYPYLPSKREFRYLRHLTDFRQLYNLEV